MFFEKDLQLFTPLKRHPELTVHFLFIYKQVEKHSCKCLLFVKAAMKTYSIMPSVEYCSTLYLVPSSSLKFKNSLKIKTTEQAAVLFLVFSLPLNNQYLIQFISIRQSMTISMRRICVINSFLVSHLLLFSIIFGGGADCPPYKELYWASMHLLQ